MSDLDEFINNNPLPKKTDLHDMDDKHKLMLDAIAPYARPAQKNLDRISLVNQSTKKTKVMLILMPEWAYMFPPFNIARLAAVSEAVGFETRCLDINIKSYNYVRETFDLKNIYNGTRDPELDKILDYDPWDGAREWKWTGENYYSELHDILNPYFNTFVDQIMDYKPDVIGFSVYYCNIEPTERFAETLKKLLPKTKFLMGGPDTHKELQEYNPVWDYVVRGEGEQIYLDILDEVEQGIEHEEIQFLTQSVNQRLDISSFPMPKYDDFDFNEYTFPNGVNSELSRGCTAKCTFCEETHFWKYRQRTAMDALSEIKELYYNKGTNVVWFIDSLVNGNLKELRAFCKGVIAAEMDLHWTGYGRCNGKMDLDYYYDLKNAGCEAINYGIESGSQPVLDAIDKGVTVPEMEQNLIDGKISGVKALTNWIMGFPTEEYQDAANTLTFMWRMRNNNIKTISPGFGFGLGMNTVVGQNPSKFGVLDHKYLNGIITHDFKLSKFHILVRMKSFYVFLKNMITEEEITSPNRYNIDNHHVKIEFNANDVQKDIEYENFDYNIIKANINPFADSLINEIWVLLRMLWRARGGYKITILFDEELDMAEYGDRNAGPYWAKHDFEIDDQGLWSADFSFKFVQPDNELVKMPRLPFFAQDYSTETVNPSIRARNIAKPTEWSWEGRNPEQFHELVEEEKWLNENIDFSFEFAWQGQGDWSDPVDVIPVEDITHQKFTKTTRKRSKLLPMRTKHFPGIYDNEA